MHADDTEQNRTQQERRQRRSGVRKHYTRLTKATPSDPEELHGIALDAYHNAEQELHAIIDEAFPDATQVDMFKATLQILVTDKRFPTAVRRYSHWGRMLEQLRNRAEHHTTDESEQTQ